jgi:hypothetical protein
MKLMVCPNALLVISIAPNRNSVFLRLPRMIFVPIKVEVRTAAQRMPRAIESGVRQVLMAMDMHGQNQTTGMELAVAVDLKHHHTNEEN